jgi:Cu(I)-responsive transcriptional regulator
MNIGTAAERSGLPAKTIRYYEEIGLLKPDRTDNGYRDYSTADIHKLRFLQRSRSLGFSVEECRQLLSLYDDKERESADVKAIAEAKLAEIDRKLAELAGLRDMLRHLVAHCHGDHRPDCPIIDGLSGDGDFVAVGAGHCHMEGPKP